MIRPINKKQEQMLRAIAKYKFITYAQVKRLSIESYSTNISSMCKAMRESKRPLIRKIPHRNGTPVKHYLTSIGKNVLLELYNDLNDEDIHFVPSILYTDTQDQKHRTTTIDLQIELDLFCQKEQIEVFFCDRYFDTVGNNRINKNLKSKTAFLYKESKSVKADMVFMIQTKKQKELYVLELENGRDSKKAVEKCMQHAHAILRKSANEKYSFPRGYRTLWIFEHQSILQSTMSRLKKKPFLKNMTEYFLFKPLENIEDDFFNGWLNLAGIKRKIYYD